MAESTLRVLPALAEDSFGSLRGREQREWLDRIAREIDNFRAALG